MILINVNYINGIGGRIGGTTKACLASKKEG